MRNMQYWRVHVCLPLSFKGSQSRRGPTPHHVPWMPHLLRREWIHPL